MENDFLSVCNYFAFLCVITILFQDGSLNEKKEKDKRSKFAVVPEVDESDNNTEMQKKGEEIQQPDVPGLTVKQALRSRAYWFMGMSLILLQLSFGAIIPNLVPHFTNVGHSKVTAAWLSAFVMLLGVPVKIIAGFLIGKFSARSMLICNFPFFIAGLLVITFLGDTQFTWLGAFLFGTGFGSISNLIIECTQEVTGMKSYGKLLGMIQMVSVIPGILGPLYSGLLFDSTRKL
eukprot:TRINITY_DN6721_c0_g1_i1.p1 TRINITY_DN6721_c0_g1~~TRINITY_DN6721_c0_g1_i1.p1  ORF type:complete len:233 (+),score=28.46 TRINITY_DN6721_c0_g1_i1:43-741(+)